ncbi:hypothetical protein BgAZ_404410 [Babesia gibsoni]|uniref:Uncharacterized protein n=1 Tax=Babesia gibsoni TaxID=33632 RepID=A0AAD8PDN4_BABGI|nr:hypothetical protein BgAZ_404410 [Babesia gibsoni]
MGNVGNVTEVCMFAAPTSVVNRRTCALVYDGGESQGIVHALSLLSTLLNCVDELQDKRGLLICKRATWEQAAECLDRGMTDCFEDCTFPCSRLCGQNSSDIDPKDALDQILRHAFLSESRSNRKFGGRGSPGTLSEIMEYELCSQMSGASLHKVGSIPSQASGLLNLGRCSLIVSSQGKVSDDYSVMQKIMEMERRREEKLRRLIVRFVDDLPLDYLDSGKEMKTCTPFNPFVEPGMETKWNYIQAANEIAFHPEDIAVVVVVGLSQIELDAHQIEGRVSPPTSSRIPSPNEDAEPESHMSTTYTHPFDSYERPKWELDEEEEGNGVAYQYREISLYAFALQLTLNAFQANLGRSNSTNMGLTKLYFLESLPTKETDQEKFIAFLRSRFQFTYKLE